MRNGGAASRRSCGCIDRTTRAGCSGPPASSTRVPRRRPSRCVHPCQIECRFDRIGVRDRGRPDERAVDHHLDLMLAAVAQFGRLVQADRLTVDLNPGKARGPQLVPEPSKLSPRALDRRHHINLRPLVGRTFSTISSAVACRSGITLRQYGCSNRANRIRK